MEVVAEAAQERGLGGLVDAVLALELRQERLQLREPPRGAVQQPAAQVDEDRLVVDQARHGGGRSAQPLSGVRNRNAGSPVTGSTWLPMISNDRRRRTLSYRNAYSRLVTSSPKLKPPVIVEIRTPSSW